MISFNSGLSRSLTLLTWGLSSSLKRCCSRVFQHKATTYQNVDKMEGSEYFLKAMYLRVCELSAYFNAFCALGIAIQIL